MPIMAPGQQIPPQQIQMVPIPNLAPGAAGAQVINLLRLKDILEKILDNMRFKDIKYSFQTDG